MALLIRSDYRFRRAVQGLSLLCFFVLSLSFSLGRVFADDAGGGEGAAQYKINDETRLVEVAVRLYGDPEMFAEIADWNAMSEPFPLQKGRILILKRPPTLDQKEGDEAVLAYWRKHFDNQDEAAAVPASETVKAPVVHTKIAEQRNLSRDMVKARDLFAEGQRLFDAKKFKSALPKFRGSRKIDADFLPAWFYEIRTLKLTKRAKQAQASSDELLKRRPELKTLPMFQNPPADENAPTPE